MEALHKDIEGILVSKEELEQIVEQLADKIKADYGGEELTVLVILKGSMLFAADLIRKLKMPVSLEFMRVSS